MLPKHPCEKMLKDKPKGPWEEWKQYGTLGTEMMACVLVGTFSGYGLDRFFGTKPWLLLVGFVLGSVASFRALFRMMNREKDRL